MSDLNRLFQLLERVRASEAGPDDYRELRAFILADTDGSVVRAVHAFHGDTNGGLPDIYDAAYWQPVLDAVLAADKLDEPAVAAVRRRVYRYWGWAAAAAVLFAAAGLWLGRVGKQTPTTVIASKQADIPPGGNKAMLTLANGGTIILDSAANGELALQGNVKVIKTTNGELKYEQGTVAGNATPAYNTLLTPRGGQYHLVLPDGSQVWLNAASSITYPTAFTAHDRVVSMTGEAYFEVAKDVKKPFRVRIGDHAAVDVLGTHFNINAYTDEPAIIATLLEGSVRMRQDQKYVLLRPGEQGFATEDRMAVSVADTAAAVAWKNGFFHFKDADIAVVMRQLARWYDITVSFEGGAGNARFSGKIGRDLKLTELLDGLSHQKVRYRLEEGRKLVIMP